jgi:hypothetical protein
LAGFDKTVWDYNGSLDWGSPDALRDYAIKAHDVDRTIQFMRDTYMRRAAGAWNDANEAKFGTVYALRLRAAILMLDGKRDAAVIELADSFKKADYENWWYALKLDPLWMPLHEDPRFRIISAHVQRYIAVQREQLEALRRAGQVPWRGNSEPAR